jgi:hypothetical protein
MRIFTILSSNTLLIKRYVHAMKWSSNMKYFTRRHISQDDTACRFLPNLFLPPWRRRRYVPPKRRLKLNGLHGVIFQMLLLAGFGRKYFFHPEDGSDMFLRNVGWNSTGCTASYSRRCYSLPVLAELISSTLKMEVICSSETSVETQRTTRHHIPQDDTASQWFIWIRSTKKLKNITFEY